jgi:hypothetical protein
VISTDTDTEEYDDAAEQVKIYVRDYICLADRYLEG